MLNYGKKEWRKMKITKLSWAGIQVVSEEITILIDPLNNEPVNQDKPLAARLGAAKEEIYKLSNLTQPDAILITHIHPDHFDAKGILECFGAETSIYVPINSKESVEKWGFSNVTGVQENEVYHLNHKLQMIPTYSADGYGSPQVSWVIKDLNHTIIHCGDTLWHGNWWRIENQFGPFHCTFMPVNGPILEVKGLKRQSQQPACLTPEEAVEATYLLGAKKIIPIHFRTFDNPPYYTETNGIIERLHHSARPYGIEIIELQPGQENEL